MNSRAIKFLQVYFVVGMFLSPICYADRFQYLSVPHGRDLIDEGYDGSGWEEWVSYECWLVNPSTITQSVKMDVVWANNASSGLNTSGGKTNVLNMVFDPQASYHWVNKIKGPAGPGKVLPKLMIVSVIGDSGFLLGGCTVRSVSEGNLTANNGGSKTYEVEYFFNAGRPF